MTIWYTNIALSLFIASLSIWGASAGTLSAQQSLTSNGIRRTFFVYTPDKINNAAGVMLYLHGGGGNGSSSANMGTDYLWQNLADRVGVLTLFPEGKAYASDPTSKTWNDCSDDTRAPNCESCTNYDDVLFVRDLIAWIGSKYSGIDMSRVYAAGESRGSMMAQRLALEAPDIIAAVASVAGSLPVSNDNSGSYKCKGYDAPYASAAVSVPILFFKGDADPNIPFGATGGPDHNYYALQGDWCNRPAYGSKCPPTPNSHCIWGCVHSFSDTLAFWQWKHRLTSDPQTPVSAAGQIQYSDTVPSCNTSCTTCDGSYVVRQNFGQPSYPVAFDRAVGAGHHFPGPTPDTAGCRIQQNLGWKNRDALSAPGGNPYIAEEIWAFVSQFSRAKAA